jgi:hypothetical protein
MIRLISTLLILCLVSCDQGRKDVLEQQSSNTRSIVQVGGNIHEAKAKLEAERFKISYGPDYPTKTKGYLMMIVDYGVSPNGLETFQYVVGIEGSSKPLKGVIKASPDGTITSIE